MVRPSFDFGKKTQELLIPLLQKMIRAACVNDGTVESGQEHRNVEILEDFFASFGLKGQRFEPMPGRVSLLIRVPGSDPKAPSLMFMGHTDVVPAQPEDWEVDPFSAEIKGGELWGRGAVDMLNWTASQAVGFALALQEKTYPGELCFLALADEEAAGKYGAAYMVENHWDSIQCDYMVTELGGYFWQGPRGKAASLTVGEKGVCWMRIKTHGVSGHGSMPFRSQNAAVSLSKVLVRLSEMERPLVKSAVYQAMAQDMGLDETNVQNLLDPRSWLDALGDLYDQDEGRAKFLDTAARTTLSPNFVRCGTKTNIIPDQGELRVDIRFVPGEDRESLLSLVKQALGDLAQKVELEIMIFHEPNVSSTDNQLGRAVEKIFNHHYPQAHLVPSLIGGVTDGRFWRTRGTTVFGFNLFDPEFTMKDFSDRIHGVNERIPLASLEKHLEFFTTLPEVFYSLGN